jgi:hypothetical protein
MAEDRPWTRALSRPFSADGRFVNVRLSGTLPVASLQILLVGIRQSRRSLSTRGMAACEESSCGSSGCVPASNRGGGTPYSAAAAELRQHTPDRPCRPQFAFGRTPEVFSTLPSTAGFAVFSCASFDIDSESDKLPLVIVHVDHMSGPGSALC